MTLLNLLDMNVSYQRCAAAELFTEDGRRILDFRSGYCVHNTGHNGAVTLMHSLSDVHSRNIALIGGASGGVDAITGEGLRLAFRQAISFGSVARKR